MRKYRIEHRIHTLAENAVMAETPASFEKDGIEFSHIGFNYADGWKEKYWMAKSDIESSDYKKAYVEFSQKMKKIIPRISLISQCYINYLIEPFLIFELDSDIAFYRDIRDSGSVGLMFRENEKKALDTLVSNSTIPEEFYYYWNDATNTLGYSAKLLLMFSAIEALVKKSNGKKDFIFLEKILGSSLKKEIWGEEGNSAGGLRHRLVHGEYFDPSDSGKDYLDLVHKKIISWFNTEVLKSKLLNEDVVNPQRHLFLNREGGSYFIKKSRPEADFSLLKVIETFSKNENESRSKDYEHYHEDGLEGKF